MVEKKKNKFYLIAYGSIFAALFLFITILSLSEPNLNKVSTTMDLVPITNSIETRGEYIILITKIKNNNSDSIKEKLNIYIKDSTGFKHFVDMIYVELNAGEIGNNESSIKTSNTGPPPYTIEVEWKK